jgi:hypothetical protein
MLSGSRVSGNLGRIYSFPPLGAEMNLAACQLSTGYLDVICTVVGGSNNPKDYPPGRATLAEAFQYNLAEMNRIFGRPIAIPKLRRARE